VAFLQDLTLAMGTRSARLYFLTQVPDAAGGLHLIGSFLFHTNPQVRMLARGLLKLFATDADPIIQQSWASLTFMVRHEFEIEG
jgi:hypothetical protein